MKFTMIPNKAIDRMAEISANAWRLYCYLLRCRNRKTGQCNPSAARCAKAIGISARYVFELRVELEKAGWVQFNNGSASNLLGVDGIWNDAPYEPRFTGDPMHYSSPPYEPQFNCI